MRDLIHDMQVAQSIVPILGNNTTEGTGTAVDRAGYNTVEMVAHIGQSGDTLSGSVYITVKLQHGDASNLSDAADVGASDIIGGNQGLVIDAAAEDERVVRIGYKGNKRYLRAYLVFTGTHTNGTPISALFLLGQGAHNPVTIA